MNWLSMTKGWWIEKLIEVLWAYRCTPQTSTQEISYSLIYDIEAMIPIEVGESSLRRQIFNLSLNQESLSVELDLLNELQDRSKIRKATCSQAI